MALRGGDLDPSTTRERARNAAKKMLDLRLTLADIDHLPFGVSAPIREALKTCQHAPPADWSREAYLLVGRNDIAQMTTSEGEVDPFTFGEGYQLKDNLVSSYRMLHTSHHLDVIRGENRSPKQ